MQNGYVVFRLGGDYLGRGPRAVSELNLDISRVGDNMERGQYLSAFVDDHAGADANPLFVVRIRAPSLD